MDELKPIHVNAEIVDGVEVAPAFDYYEREPVDKLVANLRDKVQMHDFFWEGCGFAKRGCKNTIQVAEHIDNIEQENEKLKAELAELKEERRWRDVGKELPEDGEIVWAYNMSLKQIAKALHYGEGRFVLAVDHGFAFDGDLWLPMNTPDTPKEETK